MRLNQMQALVQTCEFRDYLFRVREAHGGILLTGEYYEPDIITGVNALQVTRAWRLTPFMTKSEIVQTVFKCCITSMEHRTREAFTYKGKRIFGPHFDVDALHRICNQLDYREP